MQILAQPALLIEWEREDKPDRQQLFSMTLTQCIMLILLAVVPGE